MAFADFDIIYQKDCINIEECVDNQSLLVILKVFISPKIM